MVDGIQKKGVIKKRRGRILTIEYPGDRSQYGTQILDFDQAKVHKIGED